MADMSQFEEEFAIFAAQHHIRAAHWKRQQTLMSAKEQAVTEFRSTAKRGWSNKFRARRYEEVVELKHRQLEVEFREKSVAIKDRMRSLFFHQVQVKFDSHGGLSRVLISV